MKSVLPLRILCLLLALASGSIQVLAAGAPDTQPASREDHARQVLIATESSPFKDGLVAALVARLREHKVDTRVIDLAGLAEIEAADWGAVVMVHTWESGQPPATVSNFVAATKDLRRVIDITTSASGVDRVPEVDAISSASVVDETPQLVAALDTRIAALLKRP